MGVMTAERVKVKAGTQVFKKGELVKKVLWIERGSFHAASDYMDYVLQEGNIIGIIDARKGEYLFDYFAMTECVVSVLDFEDYEDLEAFKEINEDYRNICGISAETQMKEMIHVYRSLKQICKEMYRGVKILYEEYLAMSKDYFIQPIISNEIQKMELIVPEEDEEYRDRQYVLRLTELPEFVHKVFFSADADILNFHLKMESDLAEFINQRCLAMIKFFIENQKHLYDTGVNNLFSMYSKLAFSIVDAKGNLNPVLEKMQQVYDLICHVKDVTEEVLGLEFQGDFVRINDIFQTIMEKEENQQDALDLDGEMLFDYSRSAVEDAIDESRDTLVRILEYAGYEQSQSELLERYITAFRSMKDKGATDENSRKLRKALTECFYDIYERVFLRALKEDNHERYIDVFLNFAVLDEKMLESNILVDLYSDDVIGRMNDGNEDAVNLMPCVFTIRQWLTAIYEGRRNPSKNNYDLDYFEEYRELNKTERFSGEYEREYMNDREKMVHFEIRNLFQTNHKITNGNITSFCPFLKQEDFSKAPRELRVHRSDIINGLEGIVDVDYKAFSREYQYENKEQKIPRITLQKTVMPDVILMPTVGRKGSMWQEISGKKRDTRARFLLPIFLEENLKALLVRLVGAFRWEMCRTVQGTYWNDIREKSLTSEYADYVQFYRKNKDLSEEMKMKIKRQLTSARNNTREMFVKDYEIWMLNETLGLARLNKVVRGIMFAYCTPSKEYRKKMGGHPMFTEGVLQCEREKAKKVKELTNRYTVIKNSGGVINEIMQENLEFYTES